MHYFIDGYNLLFKLVRAGDELQKLRTEIVQDLAQKFVFLQLDATLVFDSHYQEGEGTRSHIKNLEVIFTGIGQSADDFILQALKGSTHPQEEIVITSDKKLSWLCRRRLANAQSVEEFLSWLNKRYRNKLKKLSSTKQSMKPATLVKMTSDKTKPAEAHPEGGFDYYLEVFQKRSDELLIKETAEQEKKLKDRPKKKKPFPIKKPKVEDPLISDMQRWLEAFENPNHEE